VLTEMIFKAVMERLSHKDVLRELGHRNEELKREKQRIVAVTALLEKHTDITFLPNEYDSQCFEQYLKRCDQHLTKSSRLSEMELLNRRIALAEENKYQSTRDFSASGSSGMQAITPPSSSEIFNNPNPPPAIISSLSSEGVNQQHRSTNYNQLQIAILASVQFDRDLEQENRAQDAAAASSRQSRRRCEQALVQNVGEVFGVNLAEDRFVPLGMSAARSSPGTGAAPEEPQIKQEEVEITLSFDDYDNYATNHETNVESDRAVIDSEGYDVDDLSSADHDQGCNCLHCKVFAGGISSSEDGLAGVADASPEYSPLAMRFPLLDEGSPLYSPFPSFGGSSPDYSTSTSTSPNAAGYMTIPHTRALLWQNPLKRRSHSMFGFSDEDTESEDESPTKKRKPSIFSASEGASDLRRSPNSRFGRTRRIRSKMVRRNKAADLPSLSSICRSPTNSISDSFSEDPIDEAKLQVLVTTQVSDDRRSEVDELDSDTSEGEIALSVEVGITA
jgi:hypothetical protein